MTLARATEQWVGRQAGMSQKTGRWRRRAMLVALLKPDLDSIAVSLFVYDLVEFDKYCIRQQKLNIYFDTAASALSNPNMSWS